MISVLERLCTTVVDWRPYVCTSCSWVWSKHSMVPINTWLAISLTFSRMFCRIFCAMGNQSMTTEQSTFMVDLHQVGTMLRYIVVVTLKLIVSWSFSCVNMLNMFFRHATLRSLCLLDEFGKGTLTEGESETTENLKLLSFYLSTWLKIIWLVFLFLILCRWHWSSWRDYRSFCKLWFPSKG